MNFITILACQSFKWFCRSCLTATRSRWMSLWLRFSSSKAIVRNSFLALCWTKGCITYKTEGRKDYTCSVKWLAFVRKKNGSDVCKTYHMRPSDWPRLRVAYYSMYTWNPNNNQTHESKQINYLNRSRIGMIYKTNYTWSWFEMK